MEAKTTRAKAQVHKTEEQKLEEVWNKTKGGSAKALHDKAGTGEAVQLGPEGVSPVVRKLIGEATAAQIQAWKEQYPDGIYAAESRDHIGYFKEPSRSEVNCALSKATATKPLAVLEEFADLTYIGGSEAILKNDQVFLGVCVALKDKMNGIPAKLVNL